MANILHLPNHIEEYFTSEANKISRHAELFKADDDGIDQKTELSHDEIRICLALLETEKFLNTLGIKGVYSQAVTTFMRLQVSKDRQSRKEYVEVQKNEAVEVTGDLRSAPRP